MSNEGAREALRQAIESADRASERSLRIVGEVSDQGPTLASIAHATESAYRLAKAAAVSPKLATSRLYQSLRGDRR